MAKIHRGNDMMELSVEAINGRLLREGKFWRMTQKYSFLDYSWCMEKEKLDKEEKVPNLNPMWQRLQKSRIFIPWSCQDPEDRRVLRREKGGSLTCVMDREDAPEQVALSGRLSVPRHCDDRTAGAVRSHQVSWPENMPKHTYKLRAWKSQQLSKHHYHELSSIEQ